MFKMYLDPNNDGALVFDVNGKLYHLVSKEAAYRFISPQELDIGLAEMKKNGHDAADFGVNRMFIYSYNRKKVA